MPRQDPIVRRAPDASPATAMLSPAAADRQQATVLELLAQAGDGALAFSELQDAGVEFPASVVSELELAGVPVERLVLDERGRRAPGVRLDPAWHGRAAAAAPRREAPAADPPPHEAFASASAASDATAASDQTPASGARTAAVPAPALAPALAPAIARLPMSLMASAQRIGRSFRSLRASRRLVAPAGLVAALLAVTALAVAELGSSGSHPRRAVPGERRIARAGSSGAGSPGARRSGTRTATVAPDAARAAPPQPATTKPPPPVPVSPQLAASLQLRGHELLEAGQSREAAGLLTRAVAATGERLSRCLEPVSEACLTFAYALYDLGRAVALDGRPAEAVSILERRLEIDNQRAVVASALQSARAQAG